MGLTNDMATALAAKLAAVSGMVGAAATGSDSIPDTPYAIVGPAQSADVSAGAWETEIVDFPVTIVVSAIVGESDSLAAAYDLKDLVQAALRSGIQLGLSGSGVAQSIMTEWTTDAVVADAAGQRYQALEVTVRVTVARGMSWTA